MTSLHLFNFIDDFQGFLSRKPARSENIDLLAHAPSHRLGGTEKISRLPIKDSLSSVGKPRTVSDKTICPKVVLAPALILWFREFCEMMRIILPRTKNYYYPSSGSMTWLFLVACTAISEDGPSIGSDADDNLIISGEP